MALNIGISLTLNGTEKVAGGLRDVGDGVKKVGSEVGTSSKQLETGMGGVSAQLQRMQQFALGFIVFDKLKDYATKAIELADSWTILNGKMLLATGSSEKAALATNDLYNLAQKLRVPLAETGTLFTRLVPALKEYGGGTAEAMRVTEAMSLSLKVSNATQAESASAMLQFSQAMSAGVLRGEEFNAMADAAPRLLQALADGMGKSRGELKGLAEQGKLTTDVVYAALSKQLPQLQNEFTKLPMTVGDAWTKMGNSALKAIGQLNDGGGYTEMLAKGINAVAEGLPNVISSIQLAFIALVSQLQIGWINLKLHAQVAWAEIKISFIEVIDIMRGHFAIFVGLVADAMRIIPGLDEQVASLDKWKVALETPSASITGLKEKIGDLTATRDKEVAVIDDVVSSMFIDAAQREHLTKATNTQQKAADSLNKVHRLSAQESQKLTTEFEKLTDSLGDQAASLKLTINGEKQLTDTQKLTAKATEFLTKAGADLTDGQRKQIQAFIETLPQLEQLSVAAKKVTDAEVEYTKKLNDGLTSLKEKLTKANEDRESMGKSDAQIRLLALARERETLTTLLAQEACSVHSATLDENIRIVRERIATQEQLNEKLADIDAFKKQEEHIKANTARWATFTDDIAKNFGEGFQRMLEGGKGGWEAFTDSIKNTFKRGLVDYITDTLAKPMMLKLTTSIIGSGATGALASTGSGSGSGAIGALGSMGMWGMVAAGAVVAGTMWNKAQAEKFKHLTAEYRQANQSTGTILGDSTAKSDSVNKALIALGNTAKDTLDVNYGMYRALLAIQNGISGSAAGLSRIIGLNGNFGVAGIKTGTSTVGGLGWKGEQLMGRHLADPLGIFGGEFGQMVEGFVGNLGKKVNEAIYNKKTNVIDSGVEFAAQTLAEIMSSRAVNVLTYAEVQTTKKVIGLTTSKKVKTEYGELDELIKQQFASVFSGAGNAIKEASKAFGVNFDDLAAKLTINTQKLSLKGLSGDALTKEIESFFSSTLDGWAVTLTGGSDVLKQFQKVGEGAFETVVRLASQINTFTSYTEKLHLNFKLVGFDAVKASQAIADAAGGFDELAANLSDYYKNFFSDDERAFDSMMQLKSAFESLGITTVPKTREEFRSLVESLDLSTEAGQKEFTALMGLSGAFAQLVPVTEAVEQSIIDLTPTFSKYSALLSGSFSDAFSSINENSTAARQALVDFSGGLESLTQKLSFYYDNFYTESEKSAYSFADLDAKLDRLGITIGLSKEEFRKMMDSIDPTKNPDLYSAMLDLAPLFDQVVKGFGENTAGKTAGVGVDATGVTNTQLNSINQSADSWWKTYQPEMKAQTDQAVKTTEAILELTKATVLSTGQVKTEVATGNAMLSDINTSIQESTATTSEQTKVLQDALAAAAKKTSTAVETAVASEQRN